MAKIIAVRAQCDYQKREYHNAFELRQYFATCSSIIWPEIIGFNVSHYGEDESSRY